jgi:cellulose synthase/poly-beta-1,6-N-acetylglucosamine synthase-like glycosyltransferase
MLTELVFWCCAILLGYTHAGYPILLWALARRRPHPVRAAPIEPTVSIVVVAHNEGARVDERLANLLGLDYPRDRVEIILASDGSTDDTVARAQRYRRDGVHVAAFRQRRGKSAVLSDLVPRAHGEIVVLADARQRFERSALRALVAPFADASVGAVGGELVLRDGRARPGGSGVGEGVGFYWKYEKFIRRHESLLDSTVGVTGAIYAIRRVLFEPIPRDTLLDDVLIPMQIARRGYRVLFEPGARALDEVSATAGAEFTRKVRTLAGNFQLFLRQRWLLDPRANRLWWQTVSHKACRLLGPPCLALALGANLALLGEPSYRFTLAVQAALYLAAAGGHAIRHSRRKLRLLNVAYAFCLLNWAVVVGFWRFVSGGQQVTWQQAAGPTPSPRVARPGYRRSARAPRRTAAKAH